MCGFNQTKQRLTVVFDQGMNSEQAISDIDEQRRVHFITAYSTYFAEDLAGTDLRHFTPLEIDKNHRLMLNNKGTDRMLGWRTRMQLWDQERTVVVTFNPRTARKRRYTLHKKLDTLRDTLLEFRRNYREARPHWRDPQIIRERYLRACEKLHIGSQYYQLDFGDRRKAPEMSFRKDHYQLTKSDALFGKNIIVTDNHDWSTEEIVQLSLDRYTVERQFRCSKSKDHVRVNPFYHWTDGKIRCHLLTCVIALTVQRLLELQVNAHRAGTQRLSGRQILDEMSQLHSTWLWYAGKRKPVRAIETPTDLQNDVLKSLDYTVGDAGVLHRLSS